MMMSSTRWIAFVVAIVIVMIEMRIVLKSIDHHQTSDDGTPFMIVPPSSSDNRLAERQEKNSVDHLSEVSKLIPEQTKVLEPPSNNNDRPKGGDAQTNNDNHLHVIADSEPQQGNVSKPMIPQHEVKQQQPLRLENRGNVSNDPQPHDDKVKQQQQQQPPSSTLPEEILRKRANGYDLFSNVCLEVKSNETMNLYMKKKNDEKDFVLDLKIFDGAKFVKISLNVTFVDDAASTSSNWKNGTTLLISPHAPDNMFHLQNDFIFPVFRAYRKFAIQRLLVFRNYNWQGRLPFVQHAFNMMNHMEVVYPVQDVQQRECFEWLIVPNKNRAGSEQPFYSHPKRFAPYWPRRLFLDYRDSVHAYFASLGSTSRETDDKPLHNNTSRPILTWVSRGRTPERRVENENETLQELSKYFEVYNIDFEDPRMTVEQSIAYTAKANVLMGLHGAGLSYTTLLSSSSSKQSSMVVELKNAYGPEKKMFLNMASMLDIPYYAVHLDMPESKDAVIVPQHLAREVYDAWLYEQDHFKEFEGSTGDCLFPRRVNPHQHLSPTNSSRCYLEQPRNSKSWQQCRNFGWCT